MTTDYSELTLSDALPSCSCRNVQSPEDQADRAEETEVFRVTLNYAVPAFPHSL